VKSSQDIQTLHQAIGANLKRLRSALEMSQDELANAARQLGLDWSRSSVAAVELGSKTLDPDELLLLILVVGGVNELLAGRGKVVLNEQTVLGIKDVRTILTDHDPDEIEIVRKRLLRRKGIHVGEGLNLRLKMDEEETRRWVEQASKGEAEQKAARKLHVPVDVLCECALAVWGRSLTAQRDLKINQLEVQPDSLRSLQALRGHVTRQLLDELTDIIGDYKSEVYYSGQSD
jgi:transcriptional regulator with XRE-family HTH domain